MTYSKPTKILIDLAVVCGSLLGAGGCATIQSTSLSEIQKGPGHRVRAISTGHGYVMVSLPELDAASQLKSQCAGNLTGVQTTTIMRNWFFIVQEYEQEARAWCQN